MKKLVPQIRFTAKVVKGLGRGRQLGIPTVNLDHLVVKNLREGIYVCRVFFPSASQDLAFWGVLHYGPRPTFGESDKTLEVYLLDFDKEVSVPGELDIEIHSYIRRVMKFKNPQAMLEAINKDIKSARALAFST